MSIIIKYAKISNHDIYAGSNDPVLHKARAIGLSQIDSILVATEPSEHLQ